MVLNTASWNGKRFKNSLALVLARHLKHGGRSARARRHSCSVGARAHPLPLCLSSIRHAVLAPVWKVERGFARAFTCPAANVPYASTLSFELWAEEGGRACASSHTAVHLAVPPAAALVPGGDYSQARRGLRLSVRGSLDSLVGC